ncbi:hypothetical protein Rumeso_00147 [Rubellimicrobium mesophilum DSM 19309]|uniref:TIGR02588 family protein n=1 Tax=Rubellimicrobium mesophilum DSM 19309 TaxID=442562 RepID=A0A017HVX0_9RHOB|nr:hypothetical protein [Rubellimicrobium mesophilum]EYD78318.1 hypothetical protein Rumeso_00147 [Rubellimicrobium mesophilum DSM 19309]
MADMAADHGRQERAQGESTPLLEWVAGAIGAILTLALLGFLGWQAWTSPGDVPPEVTVRLEEVLPAGEGFVARIAAVNGSSETAAGVEVEGVLSRGGEAVETARATLDYVPGHSEKRGGLFFAEDPREGDLRLRALGYQEP